MSAKPYAVPAIMDILLRDRPYFDRSRGGVTLSGGEPLAQDMEELEILMREIKREGLNLSIDTCGAVPKSNLETALKYADSFLYDLKHLDPVKHEAFTGLDNKQILDNLIWLARQDTILHMRIPVIPGFNSDEEELGAMADWVAKHTNPETIALLPYHRLGSDKYDRLGLDDQKRVFPEPAGECMDKALKIFLDRGLKQTSLGGAILVAET